MTFRGFIAPPLNEHYEGEYTSQTMEWRRIGAIDKASRITAMAKDFTPVSVLEVGCGTGAVLAEVASAGFGVAHTGVDMADPTSHADSRARKLALVHAATETLPFPDASFDFVYATNVLEHVFDERGFLAELRRVAKGPIFVEVPCELHLRTSVRSLQTSLNIGHINAYTPESARLTLETSGLRVVREQLFDLGRAVHSFEPGVLKGTIKTLVRGALLRLSPWLASRLFTYYYCAICEPAQPPKCH